MLQCDIFQSIVIPKGKYTVQNLTINVLTQVYHNVINTTSLNFLKL